MGFAMERWYSAATQRFSVRRFEGGPDEKRYEQLAAAAAELSREGVRIVPGRGEKAFGMLWGGYGRIRGANCFAAILSKEGHSHRVGYIGEAFVLECTALGLGTCWLGAGYNRANIRQALELQEGEQISCVIAVGMAAEGYAGRPRRPLTQLTGLSEEQLRELPEWQQHALSCARMAPSAMNAQPWRFAVEPGGIAVERTRANFGFGSLDCGIAMLHVELGAAHCGVAGEWEQQGERWLFVPAKPQEQVEITSQIDVQYWIRGC